MYFLSVSKSWDRCYHPVEDKTVLCQEQHQYKHFSTKSDRKALESWKIYSIQLIFIESITSTFNMVFQKPFKVEQYMDEHETNITYNLGETCCHSLSLKDIEQLSGNPPPLDKIDSIRLTYGAIRGTDDLKKWYFQFIR